MNLELERIEKEDPTVLKVFIAEYHFLKKDLQKAYDLFTEAYSDPSLSPVLKETVRNYLVIASRELRKKDIEKLDFEITVNYGVQGTVVINKESFTRTISEVGALIEVLDFNLKKNKAAEKPQG